MPKRVFIGSAQADASHVETLKKHLKLYERQNLIQIWDESMIVPGEIRKSKIEQELHSAEIILLLFSVDLLAEDFIWGAEMTKILEKVKRREVQLIPILVRHSDFANSPFAIYAAVPDRDKPISNYSNKDEAWTIVVEQIKRSIQHTPSPISTQQQKPEPEMIPQTLIDEVNKLISGGHSDKALDAIIRWAHANNQGQLKSDASIIKSSLEKLKREEMLGMLSFSEASRESAKISHSVLNLLLEPTILPPTYPTPPLPEPNTNKLNILMITANPAGTTKLNLDKEHSRIAEKLQTKTEQFSLKVFRTVSSVEFRELNEINRPNILHFSGHGAKGEEKGGIMVQNDDKNGYSILTSKALDAMFEYFKDESINLKIVVLNACYSENQAKAISKYVPYVIATTTAISDVAAIDFSVGFYFKLDAQASNVEQAFKAGRTQAVIAGADKEHFILYKDDQILT